MSAKSVVEPFLSFDETSFKTIVALYPKMMLEDSICTSNAWIMRGLGT